MTLDDMREELGSNFWVRHLDTGEVYYVVWLFAGVYGLRDEKTGDSTRFASGKSDSYELYVKGENDMNSISPEEQKAAREKERKRQNDRITRQLQMRDRWDDKFKEVIKKRTTKKDNPFTVIDGGKK